MAKHMFTLKSVLALILFAAISTAAITSAGRFWAMAMSHAVVFCVLTAATIACTNTHQNQQRFAFAFALIGGTFFVLNYLTPFISNMDGGKTLAYWPTAWGMPSKWFYGQPFELELIVNHVATLIFALLGGMVAQLLDPGCLREQAQRNR